MRRSCLLPVLIACLCGTLLPVGAVTAQQPGDGESQMRPGEGYIFIPWNAAGKYNNRHVFVHGKIVAARRTESRCYLNFHEDWRTNLTATVDGKILSEFARSPDRMFEGKNIVVHGRITGESGRPEMAVTSVDQIMLVPDDCPDVLAFVRARYPAVLTPDDLHKMPKPSVPTDRLRVGTYNILNLFDEFDDPYHTDEVMRTKPREELENIAHRIRQLDADVLALQEVESRFYLEEFVRCFLPDMGYEHIALFEGNNQRGIDCAVLSRHPIGPVTSYRHVRFDGPDGKTYRFQRDLLKVRIEGPGDLECDLFVVHLKSKYGGAEASEPIRQAEAAKLRAVVDQLLDRDPQARFLICGDFNDTWDSASLKLIRGSGKTELTCPGTTLAESQRITYNREPYRSMIDFILCSPAMRRLYVEDSYRIISGTVPDSGSDHNPAVATFRIR